MDGVTGLEEGARLSSPLIQNYTRQIEAVNSGFHKVTKRDAFPNDHSVFKLLYLRGVELQKSGQLVARS